MRIIIMGAEFTMMVRDRATAAAGKAAEPRVVT